MQYNEEQEYTQGFQPRAWSKIFRYVKPLKKSFIGMMIAIMVTAIMDVVFPLFTAYAVDTYVIPRTTQGLPLFGLTYMAIVIVQAASIWAHIALGGKVGQGVVYYVRQAAFDKLQKLSFSFFDKTAVGYLLARMGSDAERLGDTIGWALVDVLWGLVVMVFATVIMLVVNWKLTLLVYAVMPLLVLVSLFFEKRILKNHRAVRKVNSRITGSFNEGIQGAKTTKTLVREGRNNEEFRTLTTQMRKSSIRAALVSAIYMPIVMVLISAASGGVLWGTGVQVMDGVVTYGTMLLFMTYAQRFFDPISEIARVFAELQSAQAAAERVLSLIEAEPDIVDSEAIIAKYGDQFNPKMENWEPIVGDIVFEDVSFQYKSGEKVLSDFDLHIKPGETIALVGETGSGKSTIVNLICRFYEPTQGRILIDGVDYRDRSQLWLQFNLGYVLQAPHLFSGTIRENIRYGKLEADDAQVEEAARMVGAQEFILRMEKGYDTDVGEGGNRLSTGEKQLVSFARAILADPRIFVLDEATSSIDTETEMAIQHAITKVLDGRTSFIIAHRLSTIREADRILVIQQGKVTEQGTHQELLRQKGYYYNLYTNQFREEQEYGLLGISGMQEEESGPAYHEED